MQRHFKSSFSSGLTFTSCPLTGSAIPYIRMLSNINCHGFHYVPSDNEWRYMDMFPPSCFYSCWNAAITLATFIARLTNEWRNEYMRKCRTKVTSKSTLKKQSQLTAEAPTATKPTVDLREKRPPASIIKRLWPQFSPESSDPPRITGPPKEVSQPSTSPAQPKFYSISIFQWSIFRSNMYDN